MNEIVISFEKLEEIPEGAIDFIKFFMRMEFALKDSSYLKPNQVNAEVHWDKFAKGLTNKFFVHIKENDFAKTLISVPPSKQINNNSFLEWRKAEAPLQSTIDLFLAIRSLRNNLFHGGKSYDKYHDRNNELIKDAIKVMIEALKYSDEVRNSFEG